MQSRKRIRFGRRMRAILIGGALLMPLGGCPINGDEVLTAVVQAAIDAASKSFMDSLSAYLAGN